MSDPETEEKLKRNKSKSSEQEKVEGSGTETGRINRLVGLEKEKS